MNTDGTRIKRQGDRKEGTRRVRQCASRPSPFSPALPSCLYPCFIRVHPWLMPFGLPPCTLCHCDEPSGECAMIYRAALIVLLLAPAAWADGPKDNLADNVRPVPPPGITVPADVRKELQD